MFQRILGRICFIIVGLVFFLAAHNSCFALDDQQLDGNNSSLVFLAKTDRMIYRINQEIIITVYLKNKTQEALDIIEPAIAPESFMFEIISPDGKKDKLLNIYGLKLETLRLYPNKRIKFIVKFFPEIAGNYNVNIKYYGFKNSALNVSNLQVFVVGNVPQASVDDSIDIE